MKSVIILNDYNYEVRGILMKKWLMAVLFGTLLVLGACGGGGDDNTQEPADNNDEGTEEPADDGGAVDTAAAEEIYQQSCASCHGEDLSGTAGPSLEIGRASCRERQ